MGIVHLYVRNCFEFWGIAWLRLRCCPTRPVLRRGNKSIWKLESAGYCFYPITIQFRSNCSNGIVTVFVFVCMYKDASYAEENVKRLVMHVEFNSIVLILIFFLLVSKFNLYTLLVATGGELI